MKVPKVIVQTLLVDLYSQVNQNERLIHFIQISYFLSNKRLNFLYLAMHILVLHCS